MKATQWYAIMFIVWNLVFYITCFTISSEKDLLKALIIYYAIGFIYSLCQSIRHTGKQ